MKLNRILLDTHVFLWWRTNDGHLGVEVKGVISEADVVFVSAASAWEAQIKVSLGKLTIPEPISVGVQKSGFEQLPIYFEHTEVLGELEAHHNDPFDRLLIAQTISEGLTLVTHDRKLRLYGIDILWA